MGNPEPSILRVDSRQPGKKAITAAVEALKTGALIVMPTETVYGVAADPGVPGAEDRIFAAKERDRGKPIPWLASGLEAVESAGAVFSPWARRLARRFWPGPLTLVLPCKGRTEGFRVPAHPVALALLNQAGGLLRVTSANLSGTPSTLTAGDAVAALGARVSLALDAGPCSLGRESTVVDATGAKPVILRQGVLPAERVMSRPGVLFVCTGNTCRSPMAEHLFRRWLGPRTQWEVASAGVAAFDGMPASAGAVQAMAAKKIDLSSHRSRELTQGHIDDADLVVVMTGSHKHAVMQRFPSVGDRIVLLNEFSPRHRGEDVPDPFGMRVDVYRTIRDEIEAAMPDLVLYVHGLYSTSQREGEESI